MIFQRFVQVAPHVFAERFGCTPDYFRSHIKGKPLKVTVATAQSVTIIDDTEEEWQIMKGDYVELNPAEVIV